MVLLTELEMIAFIQRPNHSSDVFILLFSSTVQSCRVTVHRQRDHEISGNRSFTVICKSMSCPSKHIAHAQMYILSAALLVDSSKYSFICMSQMTAVAQTPCRPRRKSSPYSTHLFLRHSNQKRKQHTRVMLELPPTLVLLKFQGVHAT